uniref:Putative ovule protein n=1 Tax=Solanum chacoense TaxID=4108 RepID=A0A0V0H979_SOLCH
MGRYRGKDYLSKKRREKEIWFSMYDTESSTLRGTFWLYQKFTKSKRRASLIQIDFPSFKCSSIPLSKVPNKGKKKLWSHSLHVLLLNYLCITSLPCN